MSIYLLSYADDCAILFLGTRNYERRNEPGMIGSREDNHIYSSL